MRRKHTKEITGVPEDSRSRIEDHVRTVLRVAPDDPGVDIVGVTVIPHLQKRPVGA